VSSSSLWRVVAGNDLVPLFCLEVEGVQVVEGNSLVVDTTMSSEEVDLLVVEDGSRVGSGGWRAD
jgi:hypothetical protein